MRCAYQGYASYTGLFVFYIRGEFIVHIINIKRITILLLILVATSTMGMRFPMKKMIYTVVVKDRCEQNIHKILIEYDGQDLLQGGSRDIGHKGGGIYTMPMIIPKIATVSWEEENGSQHKYDVPLRKLIKTRDILGRKFKIIFSFCDADLSVIFGKKVGQFEYDEKEIWTSKN